ncbi:MAG: hypothetical protein AAFO07_32820 [Bacteroidota bacterium]
MKRTVIILFFCFCISALYAQSDSLKVILLKDTITLFNTDYSAKFTFDLLNTSDEAVFLDSITCILNIITTTDPSSSNYQPRSREVKVNAAYKIAGKDTEKNQKELLANDSTIFQGKMDMYDSQRLFLPVKRPVAFTLDFTPTYTNYHYQLFRTLQAEGLIVTGLQYFVNMYYSNGEKIEYVKNYIGQ